MTSDEPDSAAAPEFRAPPSLPRPQTPRSGRTMLIVGLIAFLLGLAAMGWIATRWKGGMAYFAATPAAAPAAPQTGTVSLAPAVPAMTPASADALAARVHELEARLTQIDMSAKGAAGNAARAEALLVAFAARRALDRGVPLGYLEGQLRERFGQSQPDAVNVIFEAAAKPVTLEELQIGLEDLGPALSGGGPESDWWSSFQRELFDLVVIRRAGTPSPAPAERLRRARQKLGGGQVDAALAEVARMPGQAEATNWMEAARRYIDARHALDTIEAAAIVPPKPGVPQDGAVLPIPST